MYRIKPSESNDALGITGQLCDVLQWSPHSVFVDVGGFGFYIERGYLEQVGEPSGQALLEEVESRG